MLEIAHMLAGVAVLVAATFCRADDARKANAAASKGTAAEPVGDENMLVPFAAFIGDLKCEKPELAAVKTALDSGDVQTAARAYIAYFRTKDMTSDLFTDWARKPRESGFNTSGADGLLAGHLWDGYNVCELPATGIDWRQGPLPCITRFPVLDTLRQAMFHTRDAKYARWAADHVAQYMDNWPVDEFIGKGTQGWVGDLTVCRPWHWCMHPQRITELSHTLVLLREFREVTDDELLAILHRMYQETIWIRVHIQQWVDMRHNGGLGMITGLAYACQTLEDFRASDSWGEYNVRMATQYIHESFYPDGQCLEMTCAYSQSVVSEAQSLAYMFRDREGMQRAVPLLKAMVDWAIGLRRPTGLLPAFGDLYPADFRQAIYRPILDWIDVPYAKTILGEQDAPLPPFLDWPPPGAKVWAGRYVLRSDWSPNALYLCLHAGPFGISHQHGDKLTFVVSAHGADFIVDPSSTKYRSNEPGAFISTQAAGFLHNVITVDGVDPYLNEPLEVTEPLDNPWQHGEHHAFVAGDYSFAPAKQADWQRRIVFVDRSYWVLQDVITSDQPTARIEQNFQFEKDTEVEIDGNRVLCTAPNGARLMLVALEGGLQPTRSVGDRSPHVTYWAGGKQNTYPHSRGWMGRGHALMPAPAVTYAGQMQMPATITLAMVPIAPGSDASSLPAITAQVIDGKTAWTLPHDGGVVTLTANTAACEVVE